MIEEVLARIVSQHHGMVFDFEQDGQCVLDCTGRRLLHLQGRAGEETSSEDITEKLRAFFEPQGDAGAVPCDPERLCADDIRRGDGNCNCKSPAKPDRSRLEKTVAFDVTIPSGVLGERRSLDAVMKFLHGVSAEHVVRSVVWFRRQPASWKAVLGLLVTEFRENQNVGFTLAGPFTEMPEEEKEFLFSNNVRLLYDRPPLPLTDCCRAVLEGLCEFGFKVPVIWFVTNSNIRAIRAQIDSWLDANYNSGLALPLVSHHPFAKKKDITDLLPSGGDYISLLVDVYRLYPDYDEVLFPLCSFAARSFYGNWSDSLSVPRHLQFYADPKDGLSFFSQAPSQKVPWTTWDSLARMQADQVAENAFSFYRESIASCLYPTCSSCSWKNLCGGQQSNGLADGSTESALLCEVTRFFLRSFLWQRMAVVKANSVIPAEGACGQGASVISPDIKLDLGAMEPTEGAV